MVMEKGKSVYEKQGARESLESFQTVNVADAIPPQRYWSIFGALHWLILSLLVLVINAPNSPMTALVEPRAKREKFPH
jgi:hypothetical protein